MARKKNEIALSDFDKKINDACATLPFIPRQEVRRKLREAALHKALESITPDNVRDFVLKEVTAPKAGQSGAS